MDTNPLRTTLDTLRTEREGAERRASELDEELKAVGQRLTHLRGAIDNIEALLGVPSVDDEAALAHDEDDVPTSPATPREIDFTNVPDRQPRPSEVSRKRVPSTEWVADVVNAIRRPADRDAIFAKFEEMKGIPESWTANPRNSFNNALGRAVERKLILKLNDNEFASMDYNPFEDDADDDGGHDG